jgi:hypothetical protein
MHVAQFVPSVDRGRISQQFVCIFHFIYPLLWSGFQFRQALREASLRRSAKAVARPRHEETSPFALKKALRAAPLWLFTLFFFGLLMTFPRLQGHLKHHSILVKVPLSFFFTFFYLHIVEGMDRTVDGFSI